MTDSSLIDEQAGVCGQIRRDAGGGGVRPLHGAESVGHEDIRHVGKRLGEVRAVLLLADVEAEVLKQHDLAGLESGGLGLCVLADYIPGKDNILTESSDRRTATGPASAWSSTRPGLPRWEQAMTAAPCSSRYLIVGIAALMRLSLVISPVSLFWGTLKSQRSSTFCP